MTNLETNKKYCEVIESKIKLDAKPVAMKLIKTEEDLPEGYELIDYGNPIKNVKDNNLLSNYLDERLEYIRYTIDTISSHNNKNIIQARGPETLFTYSKYYPVIAQKDWDIEGELLDEFTELKKYYSDIVVMLDFTLDEIRQRCAKDLKARTNMSFWENLWFNYERSYFNGFSNLIRINNINWGVDECVEYIKKEIKEHYDKKSTESL